jgi:hypothetical protein
MQAKPVAPAVEKIDTSYLESLVGYNARRATLVIVDAFLKHMATYSLPIWWAWSTLWRSANL